METNDLSRIPTETLDFMIALTALVLDGGLVHGARREWFEGRLAEYEVERMARRYDPDPQITEPVLHTAGAFTPAAMGA